MINIIIPCTPNYSGKNIINTVNKKIDMVSQFILLYNSIIKNWSFDYKINLFHNKNIPFKKEDKEILDKLDIEIFGVEQDHNSTPYQVRCNAVCHKEMEIGTHRLVLDCDTVALKQPKLDLDVDWQVMYANSVIDETYYEFINTKYDYNLNLKDKVKGPLFSKYMDGDDYSNFFPHFNGGAYFMKEGLCKDFKQLFTPSYGIVDQVNLPRDIRHIGIQYGASFALAKISTNWKPFEPGFNYLVKSYDIAKFNKNNVSLLHYCGTGGFEVAYRDFGEEIDHLRRH